jgi:hypothetical protein
MKGIIAVGIVSSLIVVAGTGNAAAPANGQATLDRAATEKKYAFVFFFKEDNEQTAAQRKVFDAALAKLADKALPVVVNAGNADEKDIVAKYRVASAPMPLVLAVAPNGAITGGFPGKFDEPALLDAVAGAGMQQCMKALQDRRLVFVCVQNGTTKSNDAAMQGVNDFKADAKFAKLTEVVKVDPTDAGERKLLGQLQVDPKATEATTAFLAPPGVLLAKVTGATDKKTLEAALQKASSGSGCGPGSSSCAPGAPGCGPKK